MFSVALSNFSRCAQADIIEWFDVVGESGMAFQAHPRQDAVARAAEAMQDTSMARLCRSIAARAD